MYDIGFDGGFSAVKVRHNGGRFEFPSVVGRAVTGAAGYSFEHNGLAIKLDGEDYFTPLGETALVHQRQASGQRDGSWVTRDEWLRLFLAGIGSVLKSPHCDIRVVTGLPVDDWARYAGPLKERLDGQSFSFQLRGRNPQSINVVAVKVPSQPFGTLFSVMFDAFGNALENNYSTTMGAIVDVGGHTTNVLTVDRLVTVDDMSGSRPLGLLHALDAAVDEINATFPRLGYTTHDVAEALARGHIVHRGERHDVRQYTDSHLAEFVHSIVSFVNNTLARAGRVEWLLLTGGGVEAVGNQLKTALAGDFGHVEAISEPRWANVEGYLRIARRATKEQLW